MKLDNQRLEQTLITARSIAAEGCQPVKSVQEKQCFNENAFYCEKKLILGFK